MIENTIAWLIENDPAELHRQQLAASRICKICSRLHLPFEGQVHAWCENLIHRGVVNGFDVFGRDDYKCKNCGAGSYSDLTVDHIYPRSRGGSNDPSNLQTLCRGCNSDKGNGVLNERGSDGAGLEEVGVSGDKIIGIDRSR